MSSCPGERDGHSCCRPIYRCRACGAHGCEQGACENVNFVHGKCQTCGKSAGKDPT